MSNDTGKFPCRRDAIYIVSLAVLVCGVFAQTVRFSFIRYDDPNIIYQNPEVCGGLSWAGVRWAFTHAHHYLYMPLTSLTHMADVSLYGLHAGGHHATSLLLHLLNACLLYAALTALTGKRGASFFVAALFAAHPLRAASVAWLASRKDLTGGLFFFALLWAYAWYAHRPGWRRYLLVAAMLALGLLSKPVLVTAPCVLLLLDWWPLERIAPPRWRDGTWWRGVARLCAEKIPLVLLAAGASRATALAERLEGGGLVENALPLSYRAADALLNYPRYLELFFAPFAIAIHYPPKGFTVSWPAAADAACLLLAVTIVALLYWRKRYLAVGWFWFLGMLAPNIGLVRYDHAPFAARHSYLPLIGVSVAMAFAADAWYAASGPGKRRALSAAAIATLAAAALLGYWQTSFWRDTETVFQRALAVTRNNDVAHKILGTIALEAGKSAEALEHFRKAVEADPTNSDAYIKLGQAQLLTGHYAEAAQQFALVAQFLPGDPETYRLLGEAAVLSRRYEQGRGALEQANLLGPGNPETLTFLGAAARLTGDKSRAEQFWNQALAALATAPAQTAYLADMLYKAQCLDAAAAYYVQALTAQPDNALWNFNLGSILLESGQFEAAGKALENAVQANPANFMAQANLGLALLQSGKAAESLPRFEEALRLQPNNANILASYGLALEAAGRQDDAAKAFKRALEMDPANPVAKSKTQ